MTLGWLGMAVAGSANYKSLDTIDAVRLRWTIPGAVLIMIGISLMALQVEKGYAGGPAWIVTSAGFASWSVGNSMVTRM